MSLLLDEAESPASRRTVESASRSSPESEPEPEPTSGRRRGTVTIDLTRAVHPVAAGINAARDVETLDLVARGLQRALEVANSVSRQVVVTGGPLSPLPPGRSMISRFEVISFPNARRAAMRPGGSRNDLLVAVAAGGLGLYHERLGQPTAELRLATPARQRRGDEVRWQLVRPRPGGGPYRDGTSWAPVRRDRGSVGAGPERAGTSTDCRIGVDDQPPAHRGCCFRHCTRRRTPSTSRRPRCRAPGIPAHLRIARRSELSVRTPARLSPEPHRVRQRRSPRCGDRARPHRDHRAGRPSRVHPRCVLRLRPGRGSVAGGCAIGARRDAEKLAVDSTRA